jgi:hypothetical protein
MSRRPASSSTTRPSSSTRPPATTWPRCTWPPTAATSRSPSCCSTTGPTWTRAPSTASRRCTLRARRTASRWVGWRPWVCFFFSISPGLDRFVNFGHKHSSVFSLHFLPTTVELSFFQVFSTFFFDHPFPHFSNINSIDFFYTTHITKEFRFRYLFR